MDIKIRVKNKEHSKAIQERLFYLGCGWVWSSKVYKNLDQPYILAHKKNMNITYYEDGEEHDFNKHKNKEVTLDDLYDMSVVENIPEYTMEELTEIVGHEFKIIK